LMIRLLCLEWKGEPVRGGWAYLACPGVMVSARLAIHS
jgi:hypothetical protein